MSTADRLHSVAIHLLRGLRRVDRETGLSGPRLSALSVIVFRAPVTLTDLAVRARYQLPWVEETIAIAPHIGFSIPVADYETFGFANAGILGPLSPLGHITSDSWREVMGDQASASSCVIRASSFRKLAGMPDRS